MDRNLQILGLAKKAGLLAIGCDAAGIAARKGQTKLIISASDASERAFRNARMNADSGGAICMVVPFTKFELGSATGQGSPGTLAFLDTGLAVRFIQGLAETEPEICGKVWKFLEQSASTYEEKETRTASGKTAKEG
jgi:ribosomal protein L7Ae-like RNA K-turn-binding protein